GVRWTLLALRRETPVGGATASMYTAPVNHSLDPLAVWMLFFVTCISLLPHHRHRLSSLSLRSWRYWRPMKLLLPPRPIPSGARTSCVGSGTLNHLTRASNQRRAQYLQNLIAVLAQLRLPHAGHPPQPAP